MIYLDNAATTYPKPSEVSFAVIRAMEAGGNPGRSSHSLSRSAAELVYQTREAVARLFDGEADRVVFTQNATYALNLAIKGIVPKGAHLLLSEIEHNATLRPVLALCEKAGVTYDLFSARGRFPGDTGGILADIKAKIRPETAAIICCHRSNILPIELPIEAIGALALRHGLSFIVDASQSAGTARISMKKCHITALCAPGHKGLYGIRGCGFVLFGNALKAESLTTLIEGGSGTESRSPHMPSVLPERLEAGTLPVEAIAALGAGIDFVRRVGVDTIGEKERRLTQRLREQLLAIPNLRLYFPRSQIGATLLFNLGDKDPAEVANYLDSCGFALREGLHCAPLAHRLSGTETTGALRASVGYFNTAEQMDALAYALKKMS